jgi:hypothetical protein
MLKNDLIKWVATAVTLVGALSTSLDIHPLNIYILNLGSVIWLIWAIRVKENSLIAVNLGLLAIYAIGLFI